MKYHKKITGERLYLSPVDPDEADAYLGWVNEDRTLAEQFGQYPLMVSSKNDMKWIYRPPDNMRRFAIALIDSDALIGSISLHNIDHLNRSAYIGVMIGGGENRGKGYGTEAVGLILGYGFLTMNLHSIHLTVHADNTAGIRCYEKAGFREVGRQPEMVFVNGKYVDKIYMSILEGEFNG